MDIITTDDLASYVTRSSASAPAVAGSGADLIVGLANGTVSDVIGDLAVIPTRVMSITLEIAARAWRNPNGYSSESVDDYTYRRDADTRQAGVYLTDAERAELLGLSGRQGGSGFTIKTTSPLDVA